MLQVNFIFTKWIFYSLFFDLDLIHQIILFIGSRIWKSEKKDGSFGECEFSVRLDKECASERDSSVPDLGSGFLRILSSNLYLQLQMNSISGLVEFFEDEMVSKPMPSKVILDNLQIQLQVCYFMVKMLKIWQWNLMNALMDN